MNALKLEPIVSGVFDWIKANLPAAIAAVNAEVTDGLTLADPARYQANAYPDPTVASCLSLNVTSIAYQGAKFGTEAIEPEFVLSWDIQANSPEKALTLILRAIDALQNLFFSDCTFGGLADTSDMVHCDKHADPKSAYLDLTFKALFELK